MRKGDKTNIIIIVLVLANIAALGAGFFWMRNKANWQTAVNVEKLDKLLEGVARHDFMLRDMGKLRQEDGLKAKLENLTGELESVTSNVDFLLDRASQGGRSKPNAILILNDTLRGDCLGFNGNRDVLTPNLDRFAKGGINFKNAISQAGWTMPSVTSILTGEYPIAHGRFTRHRFKVLDQSIVRIQEAMQNAGYYTMAIVGKSWTQFHDATDRGFNQIFYIPDDSGKKSIDQILSFLRTQKARPYFILLHILDPHDPYLPAVDPFYSDKVDEKVKKNPELKKRMVEGRLTGDLEIAHASYGTYLREIEELDQQYGRLFTFLDKCPKHIFDRDRDVMIFTSDHGEEFEFENGNVRHGRTPFIETMRVPLVFRLPDRAPAVVERYCENASIYSTLMKYLKIPRPDRSWPKLAPGPLLEAVGDPGEVAPHTYAMSEAIIHQGGVNETKTLIRSDGMKLVYDTKTKKRHLFNLVQDPKEEKDLLSSNDNDPVAEELFKQMKRRTLVNYAYK